MTKPVVLDLGTADDGLVVFKYSGKEIVVDILDTIQKLQEIHKERQAGGESFTWELDQVSKLLEGEGLEKVTKTAASKFMKFINELTAMLKKNIEQTVLLPTHTESTPQDSQKDKN